jgi:RNA polymerase sigma factor (TIGR02999 family)
LQPTALVHEVYLRLIGKPRLPLESRRQFFFAAARAMRDILVEQARRKAGPKRGGGRRRVELSERVAIIEPPSQEVQDLHEALDELEQLDARKARIVELRYFTGMSMKETAEVLGLSERTLHRQWRFIKAWLKKRLGEPG